MNILSLISFTSSFFLFAAGIYVICMNRYDIRSMGFLAMSLGMTLWTFAYSFLFAAPNGESAFFWYRLSSIGWCIFPSAVMFFGFTFSHRPGIKKWRLRSIILIVPPAVLLYWAVMDILPPADVNWGGDYTLKYVATVSPFFWGFHIWNVLCQFFAWVAVYRYRKKSRSSRVKRQSMILLFSLALPGWIFFSYAVFSAVSLPEHPAVGQLVYVIGMAGTAFALVRYRPLSLSESTAGDKIISQMMDLLFFLDPEGRIRRINRQVQLSLGYREDEMLGRPMSDLIGDESLIRKISAVGSENFMICNEEIRIKSRLEDSIPLSISVSPILDEFKEPFGMVIVGHDIREKLELEKRNAIMEKELRLAQQIQKGIIPDEPPQVPGAVISSLYRPLAMLGGDYYDFLKMPDPNKIGIFIGDVSGHGVPAALITSMIKTILDTAGDLRMYPSKLMEYINRTVTGQIGGNFITAIYGIFDAESAAFRYSRGGHDYPLLIRGGNLSVMKSHGRILGIENDVTYGETEITLEPGDKLVLYTDGLREEFNEAGQQFGDILNDEILRASPNKAKLFISAIYSSLLKFKGKSDFYDDVSIVCLEVLKG